MLFDTRMVRITYGSFFFFYLVLRIQEGLPVGRIVCFVFRRIYTIGCVCIFCWDSRIRNEESMNKGRSVEFFVGLTER